MTEAIESNTDSKRKLASIQKIDALEPIEGADQIVKARVLGWELVVKKDEFKVGDLCCFCEIDSILPDKPEFEFLRPRKFRIKTVRLRGQISQGIAFPISLLLDKGISVALGDDVTEAMGIVKWEPIIPAQLAGKVKGSFPAFLAKTDETRVQLLQHVLDRYVGLECYYSEKIDGSSATYFLRNGEFGVCSRNLELLETPENSFWTYARETKLEEKMRAFCERHKMNVSVQGELIGNGVQKNALQLKTKKVLFFNVFDIDKFRYLDFEEFKAACREMELEMVPILDENFKLIHDIPKLVEYATAKSAINPNVWREGIVIRPKKEIMDLAMAAGFGNGRLSFKCLNPEYLLKYEG
jgi:RNA ligase (TIGR02306 family)